MSFDSTLQINFLGYGDEINFDMIYDEVEERVVAESYPAEVAMNLRHAFETGQSDFAITAAGVRGLVMSIGEVCPSSHFEARATGEALTDTWVGIFEMGTWTLDEGPWD